MTDNNNQPTTPPEGATGTQPGNPAATPDVRTFTQADVDRMIADRLGQQKRSLETQFSTQYADYGTLKERSDKLKTIEDGQKTELQRIQDDVNTKMTELQNKLTNLTTERDTLSVSARAAQIKAAVMAEAGDQGVVGKQLVALEKLVDQSKLEFNDKGEVTNAAAMVTKAIEEYPFLKASEPTQQPPAKPGAKINPTNPAGSNPATETDEQRYRRVRYGSVNRTFGDGGVTPPQEKGT